MKKFTKMSLAAAVAVAGFSTQAYAKPVAEMIKDTDMSGFVRYRFTSIKNGDDVTTANTADDHNYKVVAKLNTKVNDNVKFGMKMAGAASTTDDSGDADPQTDAVKEAKFTISLPFATVIAGKQGLATPFGDAADQQGTGVVALIPAGPVTLAAGMYFNSDAKSIYNTSSNRTAVTNAGYDLVDIKGNNIGAVAVLGKAAGFNYSVWYAQVAEENIVDTAAGNPTGIKAGATAMNLNVKGKVGPVSLEVNHATVSYSFDDDNNVLNNTFGLYEQDPSQTRVVASMGLGKVNLTAGVVSVGEDGGDVTLGDTDASANFMLEDVSATGLADGSIVYLGVGANVAKGVSVKAEALSGSGKEPSFNDSKSNDDDRTVAESKLSVAYAMSKNFKISAFVSQAKVEDDPKNGASVDIMDESKKRVEIKYTF